MDLNIIIEDCGDPRDSNQVIQQKLDRCRVLGFQTVALSVIIDVKKLMNKNKLPTTAIPAAPDLKNKFVTSNDMRVYTRLTAKVGENLEICELRKSKQTSTYNLLALEPQNANILQQISMGSFELDILTFNLCDRLDYSLFKIKYRLLEDRGVCTEINYGPAQMGESLRRNTIGNGQNLTEKTSRNLILSNGVRDHFRLRGPKDAASLGVLFLLAVNKCHDAVYKNAQKALNSAKHRKSPTSSAIELVRVKGKEIINIS